MTTGQLSCYRTGQIINSQQVATGGLTTRVDFSKLNQWFNHLIVRAHAAQRGDPGCAQKMNNANCSLAEMPAASGISLA